MFSYRTHPFRRPATAKPIQHRDLDPPGCADTPGGRRLRPPPGVAWVLAETLLVAQRSRQVANAPGARSEDRKVNYTYAIRDM